ncbi:MAG: YraN family protein [Parcubacteria group bacterium]
MQKHQKLGFLGENIATHYLKNMEYKIVMRNYRKAWGEIDIIAKKNNVFIFVEVKANDKDYGIEFSPEKRVNPNKIAKITKTAKLYLEHEQGNPNAKWQIDIISVTLNRLTHKARILHFKNVAESYS